MKKLLKITLPIIALGMACAVPSIKPLPAFAEGEEPEISAVSSESLSEEAPEEQGKFDVDSILIDGKTIAEWKRDLKDENTRNSTLIAIAVSLVFALLSVLKILSERGILKKNKDVADENQKNLLASKERYEEYVKAIDATSEKAKESMKEITDLLSSAKTVLEENKEAKEQLVGVLLEIIKADPNQVKAETYKKAMKIIKGGDNEQKE